MEFTIDPHGEFQMKKRFSLHDFCNRNKTVSPESSFLTQQVPFESPPCVRNCILWWFHSEWAQWGIQVLTHRSLNVYWVRLSLISLISRSDDTLTVSPLPSLCWCFLQRGLSDILSMPLSSLFSKRLSALFSPKPDIMLLPWAVSSQVLTGSLSSCLAVTLPSCHHCCLNSGCDGPLPAWPFMGRMLSWTGRGILVVRGLFESIAPMSQSRLTHILVPFSGFPIRI